MSITWNRCCLTWRVIKSRGLKLFQLFEEPLSSAAWLSRADRDGSLGGFLDLNLTPPERSVAKVEEWILGVLGVIRDIDREHPVSDGNSCNNNVFRLH